METGEDDEKILLILLATTFLGACSSEVKDMTSEERAFYETLNKDERSFYADLESEDRVLYAELSPAYRLKYQELTPGERAVYREREQKKKIRERHQNFYHELYYNGKRDEASFFLRLNKKDSALYIEMYARRTLFIQKRI
ncbi:MAG: hypothetical protein Q4G42_05695 [Neisseria sp.]|nr:hypothetical protein [Neisseria sp.]